MDDQAIDVLAFVLFGLEYFDGGGGEVKGDFLFVFCCFFSSCAWTVAAPGADVDVDYFMAADVNVRAVDDYFSVDFHILNFSCIFASFRTGRCPVD